MKAQKQKTHKRGYCQKIDGAHRRCGRAFTSIWITEDNSITRPPKGLGLLEESVQCMEMSVFCYLSVLYFKL